MTDPWLAGLVRAVCRNGDVVWTQPQHVAAVEARNTAVVPNPLSDDGGYQRLYWAKSKKPADLP